MPKPKPQPQKYYKVVAEVDGKLYSPMFFKKEEIRTEYLIGKPTTAQIPNSRLFVYTSKEIAAVLAEHHLPKKERQGQTKRLFECDVKDPQYIQFICSPNEDHNAFQFFWQNPDNNDPSLDTSLVLSPLNVQMVSELTLTEEIPEPKE